MPGLTTPTYSVQVSFTDPFDTPDFVDITRFVKHGSTKRGRQHELQRPVAGTCSLTITNQDGRFSTFNTLSPYVNVMTGADSYFVDQTIGAVPGSWFVPVNCTLSLAAQQGFDGLPAMTLTATAAATMSAQTANNIYPVTVGNNYGFQAQFKSVSGSGRACQVGVGWYTSLGALIGSVSYGSAITDTTGVFSKATQTGVAPATAAFAAVFVRVTTPNNFEIHAVTRVMMSNADSKGYISPGWAPGGRGLVPARPVSVSATSGSTYPVFYGYIDAWLPAYGVMLSDQVINASDGLTLLALAYIVSSGYAAAVRADGASCYWPCSDPAGSTTIANTLTITDPLQKFGAGTMATLGVPGLLFGNTATAALITATTEIFDSATYNATSGVTLEAVIQTNTLGSLQNNTKVTFVGNLGTGYGLIMEGNSSGTLTYIVPGGGGTGIINVNDGKPHHIAVTVATTGNWFGYVDGVIDSSGSANVPSGFLSIYSNAFLPAGGGATSFTIAAIAFYGLALTQAKIAAHSAYAHLGFIQQQSGQRIAAVLTALGVPASLQNIATGISAIQAPTSSLITSPALSHIQIVENTEQGFFFVNESGIFTYYDRHYILMNTSSATSQATFANDSNNAHFKYLPGLIPGMDALDLWNTAPVAATANAALGVTGAVQDAPNTDSQRAYGVRTLQGYSGMLQTTDGEALNLSQWLVGHYSTPIARVRSIKTDSTATNPSSLPQMLGRKLLDRITISWQPIDGTGIPFTQDSLIENIQHDFSPELWTTTWGLSVAETAYYFTLNDASKGMLGPNPPQAGFFSNKLGF